MPSATQSYASPKTILFVLATLAAWTTAAFLFVLLKRAPLTHGAPGINYSIPLCSLLPWLAGFVFWVKTRKRATIGLADADASNFSYSIIISAVCTAYAAIVSIEIVLLWVLIRAR
jgi:hypothetical protein